MRKMPAFFALLLSIFLLPTQPTFAKEDLSALQSVAKNKILHLTFVDGAGLGNRLKKIASYLRYYRPRHLNLYWPAEGWVSARFSDLFAPKWEISITEYNQPYLLRNFLYSQPLVDYVNEYALWTASNEFASGQHMFIDLQYNNIPPEIIKLYLPYFEALKPSAAVKQRIDEVRLPKNAVAVQIRNADDWKNHLKIEEDKNFFELMDKYPPNTVFYLSAMSETAAAPFYNRYPGRIIELPNKDYHSMIDATADMFILGSTSNAIYQYGSTFAEVAWWLGGAKAKVAIVGTNPHGDVPPNLKIIEKFSHR